MTKAPAISSQDMEIIRDWAVQVRPEALTLFVNDDPRRGAFEAYLEALRDAGADISVKKEPDVPEYAPGFGIAPNIRYQAMPQGPELPVFLAALDPEGSGLPGLAPDDALALAALSAPAFFRVYMAPACPFCPKAVERMVLLARKSPLVHVTVIDGTFFPEKAEADKIRSAPTVLMDEFRWTGLPDAAELIAAARDRDPSKLSAETLTAMLMDGNAPDLAKLMADTGKVFPAFVDILAHPRWSVRLGAMTAFEYLAELDPDLAGETAGLLWERFSEADDTVRGDILYIIGQSGRKDLLPHMLKIQTGPFPDEVRESAAEAAETLQDETA